MNLYMIIIITSYVNWQLIIPCDLKEILTIKITKEIDQIHILDLREIYSIVAVCDLYKIELSHESWLKIVSVVNRH